MSIKNWVKFNETSDAVEKSMEFDFSVDFEGDIEEVTPYSNESEAECEELLNRIMKANKLVLGERTEGNCTVENGVITLDYRVCSDLGEDWDDDVWDDEQETFSLTDI